MCDGEVTSHPLRNIYSRSWILLIAYQSFPCEIWGCLYDGEAIHLALSAQALRLGTCGARRAAYSLAIINPFIAAVYVTEKLFRS